MTYQPHFHSTFFFILLIFLLPLFSGCDSPKEPAKPAPVETKITAAESKVVKSLKLDDKDVDDTALAEVCKNNPELLELTLSNTKITDAGLIHLTQLPKLKKIRLSKTAITDAGMNSLSKCEYLEDIDLSQTKIGNLGVWELRALPRLKRFNLYLTFVTDSGIDSFQKGEHRSAAKIEWLNLDKCPITDVCLLKLASLTNLSWMHLGGTAITDAGLAELAKLEPLKEVIVTKTETTLEGIEKLRQARPDMKVRDNISENTPQEDIDEAKEYRKTLVKFIEGADK
ncbi:MAG: hypothetical protein FWE67_09870 [Planctomycetaceae bacterium]|nr:hypothetical protein [Planctomycetaceae bacterium]